MVQNTVLFEDTEEHDKIAEIYDSEDDNALSGDDEEQDKDKEEEED